MSDNEVAVLSRANALLSAWLGGALSTGQDVTTADVLAVWEQSKAIAKTEVDNEQTPILPVSGSL